MSSSVDEKPSSPVSKAETPVKEELPKGAVVEKDISSKSKHLDHSDSEEKNKRRRIKKPQSDSTDDEVTEKGYESESYSETEDDFKASKPSQMNPDLPIPSTGKKGEEKRRKNVAASNKSTKQASIMGFFQKK